MKISIKILLSILVMLATITPKSFAQLVPTTATNQLNSLILTNIGLIPRSTVYVDTMGLTAIDQGITQWVLTSSTAGGGSGAWYFSQLYDSNTIVGYILSQSSSSASSLYLTQTSAILNYLAIGGTAQNSLLLNGSSSYITPYQLAIATSGISGSSYFYLLKDSNTTVAYIVALATNAVSPPNLIPYLLISAATTTYFTISSGTALQSQLNSLTTGQILGMSLYTPTDGLSIANWNTAYAQSERWNGGSTDLIQSTARTSLGLTPDTDIPSEASFNSVKYSTYTQSSIQITTAQVSGITLYAQTSGDYEGIRSGTSTVSLSCSGNSNTVTNGVYTNTTADIETIKVGTATVSLSCSGNANTVTAGVYTSGGYSNPSWITSISGGIVSGAVASATNATNAVNATNATNAVNSTQLNGQPASYYATQSGLNAVSQATGTITTNNVWVGSNTFTAPVTMSSATISQATISTATFSDGSYQTTAYKKLNSTEIIVTANFNTSSTPFVTITGSTLTITTNGSTKLDWSFCLNAYNATTGSLNIIGVFIDNVDVGGGGAGGSVGDFFFQACPGGYDTQIVGSGQTAVLSAGNHNMYLSARVGSGTIYIDNANSYLRFKAKEVY